MYSSISTDISVGNKSKAKLHPQNSLHSTGDPTSMINSSLCLQTCCVQLHWNYNITIQLPRDLLVQWPMYIKNYRNVNHPISVKTGLTQITLATICSENRMLKYKPVNVMYLFLTTTSRRTKALIWFDCYGLRIFLTHFTLLCQDRKHQEIRLLLLFFFFPLATVYSENK